MERSYLLLRSERVYIHITLDNNIPLKCISISDQNFYYCYALFLQRKNKNYKRGYMQKSIVIVSELYYKDLFYNFLSEIKKVYLIEGSFTIPVDKLEVIYI